MGVVCLISNTGFTMFDMFNFIQSVKRTMIIFSFFQRSHPDEHPEFDCRIEFYSSARKEAGFSMVF